MRSVGERLTVARPSWRPSAGNLNVVAVGWNDSTAHVQAVTGKGQPAYAGGRAEGVLSTASQAFYYAPSIAGAAAGANTVTVTFTTSAVSPDIRIAEYVGLDSVNPIDATASAQGSSALSDSGPLETTSPYALLVAANLVQTVTDAGAGFTRRVVAGGVPGVTYVHDSMTDVNGTALAAHMPETGGAWITDQGSLMVWNSQLQSSDFLSGRAHHVSSPGTPDYDVLVDVTLNVSGWGNSAGVRGRDAGGLLGDAYGLASEAAHTWYWTNGGFNHQPRQLRGSRIYLRHRGRCPSTIGSSIQVFVNGRSVFKPRFGRRGGQPPAS